MTSCLHVFCKLTVLTWPKACSLPTHNNQNRVYKIVNLKIKVEEWRSNGERGKIKVLSDSRLITLALRTNRTLSAFHMYLKSNH